MVQQITDADYVVRQEIGTEILDRIGNDKIFDV